MEQLLMETQNRIKNKRSNLLNTTTHHKKTSSSYISFLFTRTLLSVILVLLCAIFVNSSDANLLTFKNYFFQDTLPFTKINSLYTKYFGSIVPDKVATTPVFENSTSYSSIEPKDSSYLVHLNGNLFSFLESGVVVFLGEKENLGKTAIVQGIDGVDIWYSHLENYNLTMYDYVEKDSLVGEFQENTAILTFMKDGNYLGYEEYLS